MTKSLVFAGVILLFAWGCGPDKAMLLDTKFDAPLREKISSIGEDSTPEILSVVGTCTDTVDALMRQSLINAGADVQLMQGTTFTAKVSTDNVFDVAALEFVTQLQMSREAKPLPSNPF